VIDKTEFKKYYYEEFSILQVYYYPEILTCFSSVDSKEFCYQNKSEKYTLNIQIVC